MTKRKNLIKRLSMMTLSFAVAFMAIIIFVVPSRTTAHGFHGGTFHGIPRDAINRYGVGGGLTGYELTITFSNPVFSINFDSNAPAYNGGRMLTRGTINVSLFIFFPNNLMPNGRVPFVDVGVPVNAPPQGAINTLNVMGWFGPAYRAIGNAGRPEYSMGRTTFTVSINHGYYHHFRGNEANMLGYGMSIWSNNRAFPVIGAGNISVELRQRPVTDEESRDPNFGAGGDGLPPDAPPGTSSGCGDVFTVIATFLGLTVGAVIIIAIIAGIVFLIIFIRGVKS